ncbi:MAG: hypothetical protein JWQ44_2065 [Chthoniobacter sp.]|nr:hypothetical protein [Chthoniobacter sp.]
MAVRPRSFSIEDAREKITARLRKAGAKGALSPVTPKMSVEKRQTYEEALIQMAGAGLLVAVAAGAKTRYFLPELAPSAASAAAKIEQAAASKHPAVLSLVELKKALPTLEKPFVTEAVQQLEADLRLIKLVHGKAFVFAHAETLRTLLGPTAQEIQDPAIDPDRMRDAYRALVARGGFPAVQIAALQRETGAGLDELKAWLLAEHRSGRAVFGLGDWSLADLDARAAAIELRGERHLLVRLED